MEQTSGPLVIPLDQIQTTRVKQKPTNDFNAPAALGSLVVANQVSINRIS
jgi:hypothetical protein